MKLKYLLTTFCSFAMISLGVAPAVHADEARLLNMVQSLEKQMGSMQKTIDSQASLIKDLQMDHGKMKSNMMGSSATAEKTSSGVEVPGWLDGLKFSGDFRLRYEAIDQNSGIGNETDRNRFRYRLRFGFEKKFSDEMKVGFRLASGSIGGITSTNTTFDSNFGYKDVSIDRAYATYTPKWAEVGPLKNVEITAGKFKNPLAKGSTKMVWDSDVTPEGVYEKFDLGLVKNDDLELKFQGIAAQLVLEEGSNGSNQDAELFAWQGGLHTKLKNAGKHGIKTKHVVSFYDYNEFTSPGNFAATNGNFTNLGGLSAENFDIIEIYNEVGFQIDPLPKSKLFFDFAKNLSEDAATSTLGKGQDMAWHLGLSIGSDKKKGGWKVAYSYMWIEANSVPGVFNDSDFGHSNKRGSIVKLGYGITDYLKINFAALFTNNITSGNPAVGDTEQRLFQTDLVWKF